MKVPYPHPSINQAIRVWGVFFIFSSAVMALPGDPAPRNYFPAPARKFCRNVVAVAGWDMGERDWTPPLRERAAHDFFLPERLPKRGKAEALGMTDKTELAWLLPADKVSTMTVLRNLIGYLVHGTVLRMDYLAYMRQQVSTAVPALQALSAEIPDDVHTEIEGAVKQARRSVDILFDPRYPRFTQLDVFELHHLDSYGKRGMRVRCTLEKMGAEVVLRLRQQNTDFSGKGLIHHRQAISDFIARANLPAKRTAIISGVAGQHQGRGASLIMSVLVDLRFQYPELALSDVIKQVSAVALTDFVAGPLYELGSQGNTVASQLAALLADTEHPTMILYYRELVNVVNRMKGWTSEKNAVIESLHRHWNQTVATGFKYMDMRAPVTLVLSATHDVRVEFTTAMIYTFRPRPLDDANEPGGIEILAMQPGELRQALPSEGGPNRSEIRIEIQSLGEARQDRVYSLMGAILDSFRQKFGDTTEVGEVNPFDRRPAAAVPVPGKR